MDHRISIDMISSGMIPSGEKKQEDLSRTQYGTAPSPNALSDVYKSMYEKKEETLNEHHKKDADGNTIPHEGEEIDEGAGLYANIHAKRKRGGKMRKKGAKGAPSSQDFANAAKTAKEEVDKFDIVFNHFISEGYSEKEAYAEMANLTEEQLDEFLKALAQAGMKGAESIGKATRGISTSIVKKGSMARQDPTPKMGPARPDAKPGQTGFKASSPSQVVADVNARRRESDKFKLQKKKEKLASDPKTAIVSSKGEVMQDEYQGVDTYDIILDHFLNEGYEREDIIKVMSTVNLTEEPITATLATIGAGLMKGAAAAGKMAMGAVKTGGAALKSGMKGVVSAAKGGVSSVKSGMKGVVNAAKKPIPDTGGNKISDFAKREAGNMIRAKVLQGGQPSGTDKTKQSSASTTNVAASADLFDIVKGQLLDEGLSEEEIRDIMLTLTPDEIMKEMNQGPSTPVKNYGEPGKPKILPNSGAKMIARVKTTDKGNVIKGGQDTGKKPSDLM